MFTVTGKGILCKEPDLQHTKGTNYPICHAVAVNTEKYNDKETPHFTNLILFGERAEAFAAEMSKGCLIDITGILKHPVEEHNGKKYYRTEVTVTEWELIQKFEQKKDKPAPKKTYGKSSKK
jgi:single-stranded DNA-binding protein